MKAEVYVFGKFEDGYSQYPDNYTRELFTQVIQKRKSATEIVFHRDGNLAYYTYIRQLSISNTCIGVCVVYNDILIKDFNHLFDIFEDVITYIAINGEIIEFTNDGQLTTQVKQLYLNSNELNKIADYVNSKLTDIGSFSSRLPAVNFSIAINEWRTYDYQQVNEIQQTISTFPYVQIIKDKNYDSGTLKGYSHKLKALNDTINDLTNENLKQKDEIVKLKRQKKQMKWVLILLLLLLIGGFAFYEYAQDKNQIIQYKSNQISQLHDTIDTKNSNIYRLKNDSINLSQLLKIKTNLLDKARQKLNDLDYELNNNIPLYIYFPSWTSSNYHQANSKSNIEYAFHAYRGDLLHIPYFVSSESGYDYLTITLYFNGKHEQILSVSGSYSNAFTEYTCPESGTYRMVVQYTKDGSGDKNYDNAGVKQFYIYRSFVNTLRQMSYFDE